MLVGAWLTFALGMITTLSHAEGAHKQMPAYVAFDVESKLLMERRHINVYVPPAYSTGKEMRYPVLYMLDGGINEDFPHVATDVDTAIREGELEPIIVIGIANTERRRDMTGPTNVASDRKIAPHVGGSSIFRAFVANELLPEVARRYRTSGETAIIGESLAGLFVIETFLQQPSLFDTYIALSPSLWWNQEALVHSAAARLRNWPVMKRRLYFASAGDDGIESAIEALCTALRQASPKELTWTYKSYPSLRHINIYRRASPDVLRKLFPPRK